MSDEDIIRNIVSPGEVEELETEEMPSNEIVESYSPEETVLKLRETLDLYRSLPFVNGEDILSVMRLIEKAQCEVHIANNKKKQATLDRFFKV